MKFIACYTKNTPYEEEVKKLRESFQKHGLDFDIEGYESRGSWLANCHFIPIFVKKMLLKYPRDSLVYLDADATVEQFPTLFFDIEQDKEVDFAVYHLVRGKTRELLDGTMYFRNSAASHALVDAWIKKDTEDFSKGVWEQKVLESLLPTFPIMWGELPTSYCFIFDNPVQGRELRGEMPVIVHHQASRRMKKTVPVLASTEDFLKRQPTPFVVVGNGATQREGNGRFIDSFPTVIRLNNFVIKGYETRVGQKTSAWCVNGWGDVPYRELGIPVFTPFSSKDIYAKKAWSEVPHLILPSEPWGRKTKEESGFEHPSLGLVLLWMLEQLEIGTWAYGFDSFSSHHYWDNSPMKETLSHSKEESKIYSQFYNVTVVGV
jgi:hypothetical protein